LLSSCATPQYQIEYDFYAEKDFNHDARVLEKIKNLPWDLPTGVKLVKKLPAGFVLDSTGENVVVPKKFEKTHEVMGEIIIERDPKEKDFAVQQIFWYLDLHDRHSSFRNWLCKAQMPLRIISLGLWSLSPTNWPCFIKYPDNKMVEMEILLKELKRVALGLGAKFIYIPNLKEIDNHRLRAIAINISE